MASKIFAFFCGIAYLVFGIMALFSQFVFLPPDRLRFYDMHMIGQWGFLFTWMPVNIVHDVIYIIIGGTGVLSAATFFTAKWYCRGIFFVAASMTIIGLLPLGINHLWGFLPLFSWNIMFHCVTAMLAYYYGFVYPLDFGAPEPATERF